MTERVGGEPFYEEEIPLPGVPDLSEYFAALSPTYAGIAQVPEQQTESDKPMDPVPSELPTGTLSTSGPSRRQETTPSVKLLPTEPAPTGAAADDEFEEEDTPNPGAGVVAVAPMDRWREWTRAALAGGLMALLAAVMLIIVVTKSAAEAKELLGVVLAPLVGLVGAATGFYYGGKDK